MNITDIHATPLHRAYDEVCRAAAARGAKVTGTEIIGLVPRSVLEEAGRYFAVSGERIADGNLIGIAISSMHLDDLRPFNIEEKTLPI